MKEFLQKLKSRLPSSLMFMPLLLHGNWDGIPQFNFSVLMVSTGPGTMGKALLGVNALKWPLMDLTLATRQPHHRWNVTIHVLWLWTWHLESKPIKGTNP